MKQWEGERERHQSEVCNKCRSKELESCSICKSVFIRRGSREREEEQTGSRDQMAGLRPTDGGILLLKVIQRICSLWNEALTFGASPLAVHWWPIREQRCAPNIKAELFHCQRKLLWENHSSQNNLAGQPKPWLSNDGRCWDPIRNRETWFKVFIKKLPPILKSRTWRCALEARTWSWSPILLRGVPRGPVSFCNRLWRQLCTNLCFWPSLWSH